MVAWLHKGWRQFGVFSGFDVIIGNIFAEKVLWARNTASNTGKNNSFFENVDNFFRRTSVKMIENAD
jgi:hypothetical protein